MLIAFAAYLDRRRAGPGGAGAGLSFQNWMAARPDVQSARDVISQNPAGALAPVPMAHLPYLWLAIDRQSSFEVHTAPTLPSSIGLRPFHPLHGWSVDS